MKKISLKDVMSVLKSDGRYKGSQKEFFEINEAIEVVKGSIPDGYSLTDFAFSVRDYININRSFYCQLDLFPN